MRFAWWQCLSAARSGWKLILLFLFPTALSLTPCLLSGLIFSLSSSLAQLSMQQMNTAARTSSWWRGEVRPPPLAAVRQTCEDQVAVRLQPCKFAVNYKEVLMVVFAHTNLQSSCPSMWHQSSASDAYADFACARPCSSSSLAALQVHIYEDCFLAMLKHEVSVKMRKNCV